MASFTLRAVDGEAVKRDPALIKCLAVASLAGVALKLVPPPSAHAAGSTAPVLLVDGSELAQSNAIARFLAKDLPVRSEFERAQIDEWLGVSMRKYEVVASLCVAGALKEAHPELSPSDIPALAQNARDDLVVELKPLEAFLATRTFLVGERLSLADVCVAATLCRPFAVVMDPKTRAPFGSIVRWLVTVMNQPCFTSGAFPGFALCSKQVMQSAPAAAASKASPPKTDAPSSSSRTQQQQALAVDARFSRRRTRVKDLLEQSKAAVGKDVVVCGWARTVRGTSTEKPVFIELNDGSSHGNLQIVCVSEEGGLTKDEMLATINAGGIGSSFEIHGKVVDSPAKGQPIEVKATRILVLGNVPDAGAYPLAKTKTGHSVEYLRTIAHLRPRTTLISSVARVRHACAMATHQFFDQLGFLYVHTPILTAADCEGAGEMFQVTTLMKGMDPPPLIAGKDDRVAKGLAKAGQVDYRQDFFGKPTFLTVSGQLNVECYATALSDVYTFGPTFRAENSNTTRHLAEFWMIEPEMCFATLKDDMDLAEDFVKFVTRYVMRTCSDDLAFFDERVEPGLLKRLENVLEAPFIRLTYTQAVEILVDDFTTGKATFEVEPSWGIDLGSEHERYLTEQVYKRPVILTNYPADIKAFYMKRSVEDPRTVEAMDVLVPRIGELIGGSARETDYALLDAKVKAHNLDVAWYQDLRRYGSVPHAGFGLGFERLILFVTGVTNIRDVIPFPRFPGNCDY